VSEAGHRLAVHESHDEEHVAGDLVGAMNRHDVLMRERSSGACFAEKAFANDRIVREVRWKGFDGDVPIEPNISREVDNPHAATTDLLLDLVLAGKRGSE